MNGTTRQTKATERKTIKSCGEITAIELNELANKKEHFDVGFTNDSFVVTDAEENKICVSQCQVNRSIEFAQVEERNGRLFPKPFHAEMGLIKSAKGCSNKKSKYLVPLTVNDGDDLVDLAKFVHASIKQSVVKPENSRTAQILGCHGWSKEDLDTKAAEKVVPAIISPAKDKEKNLVAGKNVIFFNMFKYFSPKAASRNTIIRVVGEKPVLMDPDELVGVPFSFIPCVRPLYTSSASTTVSLYVISMIITDISSAPVCSSQEETLKLLTEGQSKEDLEQLSAKLAQLVSMQSAPKPTNTETNADATPGGSQGGYEPPMPDPASDKVNQMMADLTNI